MALLDRNAGSRIDVKLPHSQEPMRIAETAVAIFLGLWAFTISLWIVTVLFLGTMMRGALDGIGR